MVRCRVFIGARLALLNFEWKESFYLRVCQSTDTVRMKGVQ